jgi:PhzF family phenazine biosynthesis protein
MTNSRFQFVDVFSEQPFAGNPLAVILDANELATDEMQRITCWMNQSETTFLLPPTDNRADYRVRIFTLDREMPFAGHPTLGSCHAWLRSGGEPRDQGEIIQECGIGLVAIRQMDDRLAFAAPDLIRSGIVEESKIAEVVDVLQIQRDDVVDVQWADNGPGWIVVILDSAEAVLAVEPRASHPSRIDIGIVGPYSEDSDAAFELRALATDHQGAIREDPVTGSLNASVAQLLLSTGRAHSPYVATQGARVERRGRIYISQGDDNGVWVGGDTKTLVEGQIRVR